MAVESPLDLRPTNECPNLNDRQSVADWRGLTSETLFNDVFRRQQIHRKLISADYTPSQITNWLYKEVMHTDINDPYLGLGKTLSSTYPFMDRRTD
jgi:hypothetical protein